jgi:hypothetical protein
VKSEKQTSCFYSFEDVVTSWETLLLAAAHCTLPTRTSPRQITTVAQHTTTILLALLILHRKLRKRVAYAREYVLSANLSTWSHKPVSHKNRFCRLKIVRNLGAKPYSRTFVAPFHDVNMCASSRCLRNEHSVRDMPAPLFGLTFKASLYVLEALSILCFILNSVISVESIY